MLRAVCDVLRWCAIHAPSATMSQQAHLEGVNLDIKVARYSLEARMFGSGPLGRKTEPQVWHFLSLSVYAPVFDHLLNKGFVENRKVLVARCDCFAKKRNRMDDGWLTGRSRRTPGKFYWVIFTDYILVKTVTKTFVALCRKAAPLHFAIHLSSVLMRPSTKHLFISVYLRWFG